MNIYERLIKDHNTHRTLLEQLAETSGDSEERRALYSQLKEDVTAHANAEEQSFYAVLIAEQESQEKARHSIHEHQEAEHLFSALDEMEFSSTGWLTKFKSLKEELEHHMKEEEDEVFVLAKTVISDEKADALQQEFDDCKKAELKDAA